MSSPATTTSTPAVTANKEYGAFVDSENRVHYYNCAPIKPKKKTKTTPPSTPLLKMFRKVFKNNQPGDASSGSELSLQSNGSK